MMKIKSTHILFLLMCSFMSGCSTIDWQGTGERWHDNMRREECMKENRVPCPDENEPMGGLVLSRFDSGSIC